MYKVAEIMYKVAAIMYKVAAIMYKVAAIMYKASCLINNDGMYILYCYLFFIYIVVRYGATPMNRALGYYRTAETSRSSSLWRKTYQRPL